MTTLMQAEAGTCYESPLNRWVGDAKRLTNKQTNIEQGKYFIDRSRIACSRVGHTIFLAPKVSAGDFYYVKLNSEQLSFIGHPLKIAP